MFSLIDSQDNCARFFLDDYSACRDQLRHFSESFQDKISEHKIYNNHVKGKDYDCDVLYLGKLQSTKLLVLISGTHGIEGYCGSAIQRYLLSNLSDYECCLSDCAILIVHALNPWGMAWYRRCDEKGVDVNRNFVDFTQQQEVDPEYKKILSILSIDDKIERQLQIDNLVAKLGQVRFDELFSGGQYAYANALFFGGTDISFSRKVVEQVISEWSLEDKELIVIDLHTGLGPWSFGELISDHPENASANNYARNIFGNAVSVTEKGESFSVSKKGLLDYAWHPLMKDKGCFLTLEFGTCGTISLFQSLIEESQLWNKSDNHVRESDYLDRAKHIMLRHFFPQDLLWQQSVLFRAEQVFYHSLRYFHEQK